LQTLRRNKATETERCIERYMDGWIYNGTYFEREIAGLCARHAYCADGTPTHIQSVPRFVLMYVCVGVGVGVGVYVCMYVCTNIKLPPKYSSEFG
jgi:hypothetical protein